MKKENIIIIGVVLLSSILVFGFSLLGEKKETKEEDRLERPLLGKKVEEMKSSHIALEDVHEPYNSNPPTSGPHTGNDVAGAGIKDDVIADELVVHSLEHGAAVLWYREDLSQNEVDRLKKVFSSASGKKIMMQ